MVTLVCYSHTDYTDILRIQDMFLAMLPCKTVLMINRLPIIPTHFHQVVLYDESKSYSKRVLQGLQQIDSEYLLFLHDMDLVTQCSIPQIARCIEFMKTRNIDRVDLQYSNLIEESAIPFENVMLTKPTSFAYNVNPSIWKRIVFVNIMERFDKSYRDIENQETQTYCEQFSFYKLWSPKKIHAGYFHVTDLFVFLHLTHGGKMLPLTNNNLEPALQVLYAGLHSLRYVTREVRRTMH
jgi:hypothetical protein